MAEEVSVSSWRASESIFSFITSDGGAHNSAHILSSDARFLASAARSARVRALGFGNGLPDPLLHPHGRLADARPAPPDTDHVEVRRSPSHLCEGRYGAYAVDSCLESDYRLREVSFLEVPDHLRYRFKKVSAGKRITAAPHQNCAFLKST